MSFFVIDPGLASRIVDLGRPRSRSLGVPVGGAADVSSLALGNALVGNPPDASALEVTLKGPILRAQAEVGCVLFGAPFDLSTAKQKLRAGCTFTLAADEELYVGGAAHGMRAYLCIVGGFQSPSILDSHSALKGLARGSVLACAPSRVRRRFLPLEALPPRFSGELRCLPGMQLSWFNAEDFFEQEFSVSPAMNRMGLRLQGKPLTLPERELISEPVCPGTVQVTRDGQCIVLGVDGQTIGGYPKIVQVIQADIDLLGQLRPGSQVRFVLVSQREARETYLEKQAYMKEWTRRLRLSLDAW